MGRLHKLNYLLIFFLSLYAMPVFSDEKDLPEIPRSKVVKFCESEKNLSKEIYDAKERGVTKEKLRKIIIEQDLTSRLYIVNYIYKNNSSTKSKLSNDVYITCMNNRKEVEEIIKQRERLKNITM